MKLIAAVGIKLKKILKENEITQYRLSQLSGVPESTISTIIRGKNKTIELSTLYDICSGLNMELSTFFEDDILKIVNLED